MMRISPAKLSALMLLAVALLVSPVYAAPATGGTAAKSTPAKTAPAKTAPATAPAKVTAAAAALVDLNTATKAELMKLPGIGEAISTKIIKNRPYANKAQLLSRKLVSQATYDKISALVVAKQGK